MRPKSQLVLFFAAVCCVAAAGSVHDSIFNNFLSDTFGLSASARGWLELPREAPGFLVVLMAGVLAALPVTRVGMVGMAVYACGLVGLALLGGSYGFMLVMMVVGSAGMHLVQPVRGTIAIALSESHNRGRRMGQMGMIDTVGVLLGTGFVWLVFDKAAPQYRVGFLFAAGLGAVGAVLYALMHMPELHERRTALVVRKEFSLYYVLEFVFGARKQIFLTFGPWVLIQVYGMPASSIARLLFTAALIGIVFKPLSGYCIDHFGERVVLMVDGIMLAVVCIGYGYALPLTGDPEKARILAGACFIGDNLLFALGTGRSIFVSRLTKTPQELTSTLALGVSVNHIASMTIPAVAGIIWAEFGYERVFMGAAGLAVLTSCLASRVPGKNARPATV